MIHELHDLLHRAGARLRSQRLSVALAVCWLFWAAVVWGVAEYATPTARHAQLVWISLAAAALLTALGCWAAVRRVGRDPRWMAQRIEATHPELGAMLLAALETAPVPRFKRLGYLQSAVVQGAVSHGRAHDWSRVTSPARVRLAKAAHLASLAALASACLLLAGRTSARGSAGDASQSDANIRGTDYEVEVHPGDAEIERGTTLLVIAKFPAAIPADAELVVDGKSADADQNTPTKTSRTIRSMTRSLDDPQFVGRVPAVAGPLAYRVQFAGRRSPTYRITVFDYPELQRADARLAYPEYTHLESKLVEDVRQVTAVEGTQLTLQFRLNKRVADARLVDRNGEELLLTPQNNANQSNDADAPVYEVTYPLGRSQRFKLHLRDADGRKNKLPPEFIVNVTPNKPAEIKIAKPGRDMRVSPLEELQLAAAVGDDFGVVAYGLSYALGGAEPTELALSAPSAATDASQVSPPKKIDLQHLIDFEALAAAPDQLVSYHLWADDIGPDGQRRRTLSDMYFAEVRHFDEIFREGEQPTDQQQQEQQQQQGQQGAAQQAEELAELQKQVINATWTLRRRETSAAPSAEFAADAQAVIDGQQQALDKLAELGEQITDDQSAEHLAAAKREMDAALETLTRAHDQPDLSALRPALAVEQAAYQALLKLRAREFNVTQSQQQQSQQSGASASGANSASQRQLQQLELSADENRYETQSRAAAASEQNAEQLAESRQVLNRLSDLARRQQDLNERLRELQSSLDAAKTPAERAEIERQLKRLRDQQREILRDAESLDNDMQNSQNSQNSEQMQQAADDLQQTRERVQDASEALDEGQVSQALTEGTRAERELNNLRDDFRRQTADRFTEEMQQLRDAAERLDERQQQLGEQLDEMNSAGRRSLRDQGPRQEFLQGLGEQQRELGETLDTMRDTVTAAEEPEPLLARQLYDAVQGADQQRTSEALDLARQLTEAGAATEAGEAMQQADEGVEQLRQQIDRAADGVLGDETEALRRAEQRLEQLAQELNREINQARGAESPPTPPSEPGRPGPGAQQQPANQPSTQPQPEPGNPPQPGQPGEAVEPSGEGQPSQAEEGQNGQGQPPQSPGGQQPAENAQDQPPGEDDQQPGAGAGQPPDDQPPDDQQPNDQQPTGQQPGAAPPNGNRNGGRPNGAAGGGALDRLGEFQDAFTAPAQDARGPITGEDFRQWSEGMREVEDMLDDPELSAEAARIRDRAEQARVDYVRRSKTPDWDKLVQMVAEPLAELRGQIADEIRRKESPDALAPIERDAAPAEFADEVRLYYQRLGSGE